MKKGRGNRKNKIKGNLRRERRERREFTQPMTKRQAKKEAWAQTRPEYRSVLREASAEQRASAQRQRDAADWFRQFDAQQAAAQQATEASYNAANNAMTANIRAAQEAAAKNQSNVAAQDAQFAALTGADPGSFSGTAQQMNAGAEQRAIAQSALAAPIAAAGASQVAYLGNQRLNTRREGFQQRQNEIKRRLKIKQDKTALKKERGERAMSRYAEARDKERDYKIQLRAFPEAAAERRQDERQFRAGQRQDEAASRRTRANNREDNAISRANNREDNAKSGGNGDKQERQEGRRNAFTSARNTYRSIPANKKPRTPQEWAAFTKLVEAESEISAQEAQWAVNRLRKKLRNSGGGGFNPQGVGREGL